jgi:hypothetical protein
MVACGGGGGSGGGGFLPDEGSDGANYKILLELLDALGNPTSTVTSTTPATLMATVQSGGKLREGVVLTATSDIGVIKPVSGTALTNADGLATFQIEQGLLLGAGVIEVSLNVDGTAVTETLTFEVGAANLRIGHFEGDNFIDGQIDVVADRLPAGGNTVLRFAVVDENGREVTNDEEIALRSDCSVNGQASLPETVTAVNGRATADYMATGCGGTDTVRATLATGGRQAYGTISVASPQVNSINFVSATPASIALKGAGGAGRQETSQLIFQVVTGTGAPSVGETVQFSLSTEVGGLALGNSSAVADGNGQVRTQVLAGNVSTAVRVIATIEASDGSGNLSTVSDILVVSSGIPDQDSISLSATVVNVGGALSVDGLTSEVTVRMADHFNNPVPDGTSATFEAEYGSIGASCTTLGGSCSVTWTSQGRRLPTFNPDLVKTTSSTSCTSSKVNGNGPCPGDLGPIRGGRSAILVTAIGEETFTDANGNGTYDQGEEFENLPEAHIDFNEDGVYTPFYDPDDLTGSEEEFVDFNDDGLFSENIDPNTGEGVYNGILCPEEGDGIWCSRDLINVRARHVLVMSGGMNIIVVNSSGSQVSTITEGPVFTAYLADIYNNPPAADATIDVSLKGDCTLVNEPVTTPANNNAIGAFGITLQVEGNGEGGYLTINAENGGLATSRTYSCSTTAPPPEEGEGGDGGL